MFGVSGTGLTTNSFTYKGLLVSYAPVTPYFNSINTLVTYPPFASLTVTEGRFPLRFPPRKRSSPMETYAFTGLR